MFTHLLVPIEEMPEFGALMARLPLAKGIAMGEDALFGACLFFITARAADRGVNPQFGEGVQQCNRLQGVARRIGSTLFAHAPGANLILHRTDNEPHACALRQRISKLQRLDKVVPRINVDEGKGRVGGRKGSTGQFHEHN